VAALIAEPIAANMGVVPPEDGFLEYLRAATRDAGALLVLDEVITGFRVAPGGAQVRLGITPDLSIFGKVVGGGLPLAAVGGPAAVMDQLAPLGPVYQAGTLSGNPLATAAGLAALGALDDDAYLDLEARAATLVKGLQAAFDDAGLDAVVTQAATLGGVFFAPAPVTDYAAAQAADHARYARFFHGMLDRGVFLAPSGYETIFVSLAHDDDVIARTIDLAADVAATL
jgi:glutamate-1-semialdehyde 2,1-aminomutase